MNLFQPWNLFFFVGWLVFFAIRYVFEKRTRGVKRELSHMDRQEKLLLFAMFPPTALLPMLYLLSPWLAFADYALPSAVPMAGAGVLIAALWMFWRSHADLGTNWSVSLELRENHTLVSNGVYRLIRHPMYASIWLWALGQGMLLPNWLAGWSMIPAFALMYFLRVPREEAMMYEKFGAKYQVYMEETGRLIPRMGK